MHPLEGDNKLNRLFILLGIVICSVKHLIDISQGLRRVLVESIMILSSWCLKMTGDGYGSLSWITEVFVGEYRFGFQQLPKVW